MGINIKSICKKNRFFNKLLISFLFVGLLPTIMTAIIMDRSYYSILRTYVDEQSYSAAKDIKIGIEAVISQNAELVSMISEDLKIRQYLSTPQNTHAKQEAMSNIELWMAGKKSKIAIHIIGMNNNISITSGYLPNLYYIDTYRNWGIFHELSAVPNDIVLYPNKYKSIRGDDALLSVAKSITDLNGEIAGYVIVDIFRKELFSIISNYEDNLNGTFELIYNDSYVVLDTSNSYREGLEYKTVEAEQSFKANNGNQNSSIQTLSFEGAPFNGSYRGIFKVTFDILSDSREIVSSRTFLIAAVCILVAIILAVMISTGINHPIMMLKESMEAVGRGKLDTRVKLNRNDELSILETEFNKLVDKLRQLINQKVEEDNLLKQAQIEALQAQINPHFLYNTLGTMKALSKLNRVEEISGIIIKLSKILRSTIDFSGELITLGDDIELIKCYVDIQNSRFDNKYLLKVNIPDELLQCKIPPLLLQPIVENSIIHGLEGRIGQGVLSIYAVHEDEYVNITIEDNGVGMPESIVSQINLPGRKNKKIKNIGIFNVKRRVELVYGEGCSIKVESKENQGTTVTLIIKYL